MFIDRERVSSIVINSDKVTGYEEGTLVSQERSVGLPKVRLTLERPTFPRWCFNCPAVELKQNEDGNDDDGGRMMILVLRWRMEPMMNMMTTGMIT